jgi:hypothetical protein
MFFFCSTLLYCVDLNFSFTFARLLTNSANVHSLFFRKHTLSISNLLAIIKWESCAFNLTAIAIFVVTAVGVLCC